VLNKLISNSQTEFLKGRYIGECTRLILDIIERTEEEQIPGLLLLVDFEKAFDSLEWDFMFKCLNFLGFGESIIKWVKVFYTDISSCILNNGHCSEFFTLGRGMIQYILIYSYYAWNFSVQHSRITQIYREYK
jgi:hypothetical protein